MVGMPIATPVVEEADIGGVVELDPCISQDIFCEPSGALSNLSFSSLLDIILHTRCDLPPLTSTFLVFYRTMLSPLFQDTMNATFPSTDLIGYIAFTVAQFLHGDDHPAVLEADMMESLFIGPTRKQGPKIQEHVMKNP